MHNSGEIDAAMLRDSGWFPDSVEIHLGAATGTGSTAYDMRTPLQELLRREAAEEDDGSIEYQEQRKRWMVEGAMLIIREAVGPGPRVDVVDIGLTIATWAWDIQLPPFDEMSQGAVAELAAQGRAAICERHKVKAQRKKDAVGLAESKVPRQKQAKMLRIYRERAKGNRNRARQGMEEALRLLG